MAEKGYIYVISSDFGSKIGMATDFESRFSSIQTSSPVNLELKRVYSVRDFSKVEKKLHILFKDKHIRGEWFDLVDDDLNQITNYLTYNNFLLMEVDLKTARINYNSKHYLRKSVNEISSQNEIAMQTEINNLKNEIKNLQDENNRQKMESYREKSSDKVTFISMLQRLITRILSNIIKLRGKKE